MRWTIAIFLGFFQPIQFCPSWIKAYVLSNEVKVLILTFALIRRSSDLSKFTAVIDLERM